MKKGDMNQSDPRARLGEYPIPGDAPVTRCKSCGAQIVWAKTGSGANIPLSLATLRRLERALDDVADPHESDLAESDDALVEMEY